MKRPNGEVWKTFASQVLKDENALANPLPGAARGGSLILSAVAATPPRV